MKILVLLLPIFLSACAIGPIYNFESARTVGASKNDFLVGYGEAGYALKWNHGFAENFDMGVQLETLSLGLRAKYAFLNPETGFALASALGTGFSVGGSHYYGDLMASYHHERWEPYTTLRFVHVKVDPTELKSEDTAGLDLTIDVEDYDYGQVILGNRFWFDSQFLLSIEGSFIPWKSSGFVLKNNVLLGAALGYRF